MQLINNQKYKKKWNVDIFRDEVWAETEGAYVVVGTVL